MKAPSFSQKISGIKEFQAKVREYTHVAVCRRKLGYFHHYLVLNVSNEGVHIIHYRMGKETIKMFSLAEVQKQDLKYSENDSDLFDFSSGLYFIDRSDYPLTKEQKQKANKRASKRCNETDYTLSFNNCEHLVTWILTGVATCEQLEAAGERFVADSLDSVVNKSNLATVTTSDVGAKYGVGKATCLLTSSGKALSLMAYADKASKVATQAIAQADKAFKVLTQVGDQVANQVFNAVQAGSGATTLLETLSQVNKPLVKAAHTHLTDMLAAKAAAEAKFAAKALVPVNMSKTTAATITAGKTALISALIAIPIECCASAYSIYRLYQRKDEDRLEANTLKREITKIVAGSVSSVAASTLGTYVGATVGSFFPVVGTAFGGVIGGVVGSLLGRICGSALAGRAYDAIKEM